MDSSNLGPAVVAVSWVFGALAIIVVGTRYYVRLRIVGRFTIDDWLIALVLILALFNGIFYTLSVHHGLGRSLQTLTKTQVSNTKKWVYFGNIFSTLSAGFGRIAFAFLLLALLHPMWSKRRGLLWTVITLKFIVDILAVVSAVEPSDEAQNKGFPINCHGSWNLRHDCFYNQDSRAQELIQTKYNSLEVYLVLIAASLPTLRPLMGTRKPETTTYYNLKPKDWTSMGQSGGSDTRSSNRGGRFVSLISPSTDDIVMSSAMDNYSIVEKDGLEVKVGGVLDRA
ncbi:hypothetical protein ACMFMF_004429 [Clarireedia jacksonii]